jgi:predicted chitinase
MALQTSSSPGAPTGPAPGAQTTPTSAAQTTAALEAMTLTAAVGRAQPNNKEDVVAVQRLLGTVLGSRRERLAETGTYDARTQDAVSTFERCYFNGVAHPFEPGGESFLALKNTAIVTRDILNPVLTGDMYQLAATMVPGGVGKLMKSRARHAKGGEPEESPIRTYLPLILKALDARGLADIDMLLMALATVRAEASNFRPVSEGIYGGWWNKSGNYQRGNTTMVKDPADPNGRKETKTPLTHPFDVYDTMNGNRGCDADADDDEMCEGGRYRGRGFVQLTGRALYADISKQIGLGDTLVNDPEKANDPDIAAAILAQYLKNKESAVRDALKWGNMALARRTVNGGTNGLTEFTAAFNSGRHFLHMSAIRRAKKPDAMKVVHAKKAVHAKHEVPPKHAVHAQAAARTSKGAH